MRTRNCHLGWTPRSADETTVPQLSRSVSPRGASFRLRGPRSSTPQTVPRPCPVVRPSLHPRNSGHLHNTMMTLTAASLDLADVYDRLLSTGRGKRIGGFVYAHIDLMRSVPKLRSTFCQQPNRLAGRSFAYNVVKVRPPKRISFLLYEDFEQPFPALLASLSCDVETGSSRLTDYSKRANPPVLHRKELLLEASDPRALRGSILTARLEALGAFADTRRIGTRNHWNNTLAKLRLTLQAGQLVSTPCAPR